jgi:6-phosphogluconolactonase (cycloisomerase 2 family)
MLWRTEFRRLRLQSPCVEGESVSRIMTLPVTFTRFIVVVSICAVGAVAATNDHYVMTNDDLSPQFPNSATFYTVGAGGDLVQTATVSTRGNGIGGGFFGTKRIAVYRSGQAGCVYASNAQSGNIVGIPIRTLKATRPVRGSKTDGGTSNGIGLAMNNHYLYASFTDSNTVGTFQVQPGCTLKFVGDITVGGLQGGVIDGMAVHRNMLVATYGDGSIESFNISAGMPVSNGDEQNSTGSRGGNAYPNGIDITQDGRYAIFGDTATSTIVEVSDISSGKLTPTAVYRLGNGISSSNVMLSPDESLLYISNTQGDRITAAFFDKTMGRLRKGCASNDLKGYVTDWSYLGALAMEEITGTGGVIYVAEFGASSSIAMITVTSSGGKCTLKELPNSPVADPNSLGLLSIGVFPPRAF